MGGGDLMKMAYGVGFQFSQTRLSFKVKPSTEYESPQKEAESELGTSDPIERLRRNKTALVSGLSNCLSFDKFRNA